MDTSFEEILGDGSFHQSRRHLICCLLPSKRKDNAHWDEYRPIEDGHRLQVHRRFRPESVCHQQPSCASRPCLPTCRPNRDMFQSDQRPYHGSLTCRNIRSFECSFLISPCRPPRRHFHNQHAHKMGCRTHNKAVVWLLRQISLVSWFQNWEPMLLLSISIGNGIGWKQLNRLSRTMTTHGK